jgi:hypothetical protein
MEPRFPSDERVGVGQTLRDTPHGASQTPFNMASACLAVRTHILALTWLIPSTITHRCEAGKKLQIAVLLSGGVDSSLALRLLVAAGHSCRAFYLQIWFQASETS